MLAQFLRYRCDRTGAVKVKDLLAAFRETLDPSERKVYTRSLLIADLTAAGFKIGSDSRGVATVAGLSLPIPYTVENGRLVKQ